MRQRVALTQFHLTFLIHQLYFFGFFYLFSVTTSIRGGATADLVVETIGSFLTDSTRQLTSTFGLEIALSEDADMDIPPRVM